MPELVCWQLALNTSPFRKEHPVRQPLFRELSGSHLSLVALLKTSLWKVWGHMSMKLVLVASSSCPHSWQAHGATKTLWSVLKYIEHLRPLGGVLENVMGLSQSTGEELAPLDVVVSELDNLGYYTAVSQQDLALYHKVTRQRTVVHESACLCSHSVVATSSNLHAAEFLTHPLSETPKFTHAV